MTNHTMTKTEAADMIALEVRVFANRTGQSITRLLVAEMMSEFDGREGMVLQTASRVANFNTVCRLAGAPTAAADRKARVA